jgi:hypothetical protein
LPLFILLWSLKINSYPYGFSFEHGHTMWPSVPCYKPCCPSSLNTTTLKLDLQNMSIIHMLSVATYKRTISWPYLVYSLSINEIKCTCIKWVHVPWSCFSWKIGIIIII